MEARAGRASCTPPWSRGPGFWWLETDLGAKTHTLSATFSFASWLGSGSSVNWSAVGGVLPDPARPIDTLALYIEPAGRSSSAIRHTALTQGTWTWWLEADLGSGKEKAVGAWAFGSWIGPGCPVDWSAGLFGAPPDYTKAINTLALLRRPTSLTDPATIFRWEFTQGTRAWFVEAEGSRFAKSTSTARLEQSAWLGLPTFFDWTAVSGAPNVAQPLATRATYFVPDKTGGGGVIHTILTQGTDVWFTEMKLQDTTANATGKRSLSQWFASLNL